MELTDSIKAYIDSHINKVAEEKGLKKLSDDFTQFQEDFTEFKDATEDRLKAIEKTEERDIGSRISRLEYEIRQVKLMHH